MYAVQGFHWPAFLIICMHLAKIREPQEQPWWKHHVGCLLPRPLSYLPLLHFMKYSHPILWPIAPKGETLPGA